MCFARRIAGLAAQGHDDGVAVDLGRVGHQGVDVDDQARAAVGFGREHGVDAAGAHVDAPRCERERGVRQVERDARRLVDGERQGLGRRTVQVQLQLHLLAGQRLHVDGLELERVGGLRAPRANADNTTSATAPIVAVRILKSDHAFALPVPKAFSQPMPTRPVARYIRRDRPV